MTVVFATCEQQPELSADDQILADALAPFGVSVDPVPWTAIDPYAVVDAPPILLRSTWDYHRIPTMFSVWLHGLQESGRVVWNDPSIALGNIDKIYLQQLESSGIAIPKTRWLDRPDAQSVRDAMKDEGWPKAVLKPRIAATAYGTYLVTPEVDGEEVDLGPARASGALLQEFIPEVADYGETSLVYCNGAFSHGVVKHATRGDFRVQQDFGGSVESTTPSDLVLSFADRVLATLPKPCLFARVDLVTTARGPLLMELELIEPELYFVHAPAAATTFALAIVNSLT